MRRAIVAGNWKMHLLREEAAALIRALRATCDVESADVLVCPAYTALAAAAEALRGSRIGLGAQNLHWEPQGAFTGEVSARMLADAGCRYVIIGHSERRTLFGDTDDLVRRKLASARTHGLQPIVCVGETLAEREAGRTLEILARQLGGALGELQASDAGAMILAYEPVWAIGTGRNASPEQAQEAHAFIRGWIQQRFGDDAARRIRLQYGGSVTAANAASLLQQPDVDGALVGGASLKADAFSAIVKAAAVVKSAMPGTQTA
jgi:triosephosphate isomerase